MVGGFDFCYITLLKFLTECHFLTFNLGPHTTHRSDLIRRPVLLLMSSNVGDAEVSISWTHIIELLNKLRLLPQICLMS